jgi:hypothetical protein
MLKLSLELDQLILEGGCFRSLLGHGGFCGCQACVKLFNVFEIHHLRRLGASRLQEAD